MLQGFISWSIICISRTRINTGLKQEQMTSQVFTPEALILKVSTRVCCHTSHHLTLWTVTKASLFPPSWYLHLSARNHKYNHFPNVGSLFCQLFQSVTVPLHFPCMNKWKAINMSLSLNSGSLHHAPMQRTACLPGSGFWCPICKVTKICHRAKIIHVLLTSGVKSGRLMFGLHISGFEQHVFTQFKEFGFTAVEKKILNNK